MIHTGMLNIENRLNYKHFKHFKHLWILLLFFCCRVCQDELDNKMLLESDQQIYLDRKANQQIIIIKSRIMSMEAILIVHE